jgi:hypothetical protein
VQTTAPANQIPGVGILTGQAPGDTVTAPIQYSSAAGTTGAPGKFNPNTCFGTDKFAAALTDFAANARTNGNYKDLGSAAASAAAAAQTPTAGTNATPGTAASSAAAGAGAGSATPATGTATEPFTAAPEAPAAPIQPAPADKWLKDKLCVGSFCLYINLVMKPAASSYQNADNCIACHAEKINDVLKKVISYTLVPSKAPGNLGEAGKCKKALSTAFSSVSMNIYTLAMPVQTPMNDDLVYGKTIEEDWFNYCSQVAAPFTCRNEAPPKDVSQATYEPPKTILDMVSKSALATASDDATQSDVSKNIDTATTGYALEKIAGLNSYDMTKAADKGIQTYQPLKTEMDRMIYYFTSIQKLLHSLHEPVDGIAGPQACTDLKNKKDCE